MSLASLEEWLQVEKLPSRPRKIVGRGKAGSYLGSAYRTVFIQVAQTLNTFKVTLPIKELRKIHNRELTFT
jgi:hypothetical protein